MAPKPFHMMPGPRILPIIGSVLDYSSLGKYTFERLHVAKRENFRKYGPIYREHLGRPIVQAFNPVDIERVLRADGPYPRRPPLPLPVVANKRDGEPLGLGLLSGESWWKQRRVVQQCMMHPRAASIYLTTQNSVADDLLKLIDVLLQRNSRHRGAPDFSSKTGSDVREAAGGAGEIDDLMPILIKYTMEAFGAVCFGERLHCLEADLAADSLAYRMHSASSRMFQAVQKTTFSFPWYAFFRTKLYRQFMDASHVCHGIARSYVQQTLRNTPGGESSSTVGGYDALASRGESAATTHAPNFLQTLLTNEFAKQLTIDDIVAIAVELFTAGIDSTAYAVGFCLYNLARNGDKQNRLAAELQRELPTPSDSVTEQTLSRLSYLKACVKESFRLNFPSEGGTVRELAEDLVLSDYLVPKGTLVAFNQQTMCREELYFDQADSYKPERWLKDGSSTLRPAPNFVMMPFGYGLRMCIGRRFAEQEIYLALIKILRQYRLEYRRTEEIGMINRVFTMPDAPLRITFIPRHSNSN